MNLYTYCKNNPILYTDPSGHSAKTTKWSNDQYNYLYWQANHGSEGERKWALNQINSKAFFVDQYGNAYTNDEVWNARHPKVKAESFYTSGNGPRASINKKEVALQLVGGEAGLVNVNGDYKYGQWGLTGQSAQGNVGIVYSENEKSMGVYGKISTAKANGAVKIPLPITDHKLVVGGEIDFLSFGGGYYYKDGKFKSGVHFGVGADIIFGLD